MLASQVVTGLLVAEVNVSTMTELGTGGVSLVLSPQTDNTSMRANFVLLLPLKLSFDLIFEQVSMAKRTLGSVGVQVAS